MKTALDDLLEIMRRLRDPSGGCPWDCEQTFVSIVPYTIEEAYEVADAAERGDIDSLKDELGDLLFQVVFLARIAEEHGAFDFFDVAKAVSDKLVRRHPHVFGDEQVAHSGEVVQNWEAIKAAERQAKSQGVASHMDGITSALPAMTHAVKLQRRAARVGFEWENVGQIFDKIGEELDELEHELESGGTRERIEEEMGDVLLAATNLARFLEIDPERALRFANRRFETRFRRMEEAAARVGRNIDGMPIAELEALWQEAKKAEKA